MEFRAEGEVAYQDLTITVKDVATKMETTYTGRVKDLVVIMQTERALDPIDMDRPLTVMAKKETLKIHLTAEWVVHHETHYVMTILDEPVEIPAQYDENGICNWCAARPGGEHAPDCHPPVYGSKHKIDLNTPMEETLLRLFGKGWQEVPYFGEEQKNQLLRRITRARLYLNKHRKSNFPIELDFEIGEEDAGIIRFNVRGPRTIAVPDGRHPTG